MKPYRSQGPWQARLFSPRLPWAAHAIRPADVSGYLCEVMVSPGNVLEDANYQKVVPNQYIVEVSEEIYGRLYRPIEKSLHQQWQQKMVEFLDTTNSRQGRQQYRLGGAIGIEVRPAPDLQSHQVRILSVIHSGNTPPPPPPPAASVQLPDEAVGAPPVAVSPVSAFLEMEPAGPRWPLQAGLTTIGRDERNDITLNMPAVQEKRLVSSQHAHVRMAGDRFVLYDGAPGGRPSTNGTFVNFQRVTSQGIPLNDGDTIILAATDPNNPRSDTPGVVTLRFWTSRRL